MVSSPARSGSAVSPGTSPRMRLRQLPGDIVSVRTWLSTIHLLAGLPVGVVAFGLLVAGLSAGISMLAAFLLGVPVLVGTAWVAIGIGHFERGRFALFLNASIQPPPRAVGEGRWWRRFVRPLALASTWRQIAYCLLWLLVGSVDFSITVGMWALSLALICLPAYNFALPGGGARIGGLVVGGPLALSISVVAGLVLLVGVPQAVRGLASVEARLAGALLGPGSARVLAARVAQLEDSRARSLSSAEAERARIERDLHDGAQQRLVSVAMELGRAKAKFDTDPQGARNLVDQAHADAKEALTELRHLVRGVRPPVLTDRGLDAAVSGLAALSPIPVAVSVDVPQRPSLTSESIAYFVVAESLANVAKHSRARQASVDIRTVGDRLRLTVRDDGVGGADPGGSGLAGLAGRVAGVDGTLRIDSPPGGPTLIQVELPCAS